MTSKTLIPNAPVLVQEPKAPASANGRQLILDAAARQFRDEGYAATSLRGIAAACGMKAGSLYYHFSSKDEIVAEVLKVGVERVFDEVRREVMACPPNADARTLLRTAVCAHLCALLELQSYTSANVRIFHQVPKAVRDAQITIRDAYERFWAGLLTRCASQGGFDQDRDLHLARLFLINAMNGTLEWFHVGSQSVPAIAQELTELFLNGLNLRAKSASKSRIKDTSNKTPRKRARGAGKQR
jgi:TetR/AcrR family transcriptional regulator, cholesterol catabolism regulator